LGQTKLSMRRILVVFVLILCFQNVLAERKVVFFINTKNECLGCNIGINNLFKTLQHKQVPTTVYFKSISTFQFQKYCDEVDFDFNKYTTIINSRANYESALYYYLKLRSIDSYVLILEDGKVIYKANLIKLIENKSEMDRFLSK